MLVGRERELAALEEVLARDGAVVVVGEAGVGKTALLRTAAHRTGRPLFEGGGLSALSGIPHVPLRRALGRNLHDGDAAGVAAFVADEVGDGVLLLDDLHWADHATVDVMRLLVGRIALLTTLRRGDPATARRADEAKQAGLEFIELAPLDDGSARELVQQRGPALGNDAVRRVVEAAHGNPLMLEQLTLLDGSLRELRLGLAARLRPQTATARATVARLALLGRPAEPNMIGEGVEALVEAGLLVERDGLVELRHHLLGDAALDGRPASEVRLLHSQLARLSHDAGEAARHHTAAGERAAAHAKALDAAAASTSPGERAANLKVAATTAGASADALRLEAAEALVEAGDHRSARDLTAEIQARSGESGARAWLVEARSCRELGDRDAAERAIAEGLRAGRGKGTVEVDLRLEQVSFLIHDWSPDAEREAAAVRELASAVGASEARAQLMLAFASSGSPVAPDHAREALEMARREDDGALECEAAYVLADCLAADARGDEAYPVVVEMVERAHALGLRSRELELMHVQAYLELYGRGDVERSNELCRRLLREPAALGKHLARTRAYLGHGLASLGRDREARAVLDAAIAEAETADDRAVLLHALTEAEWLAGRLRAALEVIEQCRREGTPFIAPVTAVEAWTALELGSEQPKLDLEGLPRVVAGAVAEVKALELLGAGHPAKAERVFLEAAGLWDRRFVSAAIRSLWGAGGAAQCAGAADRAREHLMQAEDRAERAGLMPLLSRIRASLREIGVVRTSPGGSADGMLTPREREVLGLVGAGLRTREIGKRLGLASSTVESHVKSAMRKLGARTRAQAALVAADDEH